MPTVTPITAGSVMDRSRFFLNDTAASIYSNATLLEPLSQAMDDLREELEDNDISVTSETSAAIEVPAGETNIGGDSGIALPNDLIVPIQCWERISGSDTQYALMSKRDFLPKYGEGTESAYFIYWAYQDQIIKFLPATSDLEIKIDYRSNRMFDAISAESQINLKNAKSFLAFQTAGYAAEFVGENVNRATNLYSRAQNSLERLLNLDIKNKQNQVSRKRPFMARFKQRGGMYR